MENISRERRRTRNNHHHHCPFLTSPLLARKESLTTILGERSFRFVELEEKTITRAPPSLTANTTHQDALHQCHHQTLLLLHSRQLLFLCFYHQRLFDLFPQQDPIRTSLTSLSIDNHFLSVILLSSELSLYKKRK